VNLAGFFHIIQSVMNDPADPDAYAHIDGGQIAGH
jgi:hypothetical protein